MKEIHKQPKALLASTSKNNNIIGKTQMKDMNKRNRAILHRKILIIQMI